MEAKKETDALRAFLWLQDFIRVDLDTDQEHTHGAGRDDDGNLLQQPCPENDSCSSFKAERLMGVVIAALATQEASPELRLPIKVVDALNDAKNLLDEAQFFMSPEVENASSTIQIIEEILAESDKPDEQCSVAASGCDRSPMNWCRNHWVTVGSGDNESFEYGKFASEAVAQKARK